MDCETSLAPTVIGNAAAPGVPTVFALGPAFPAATTVTTSDNIALLTTIDAGDNGSLMLAPKDKLITSIPSRTALSTPAIIQSISTDPYGPNTRYLYKSIPGATPLTEWSISFSCWPAIVPETCVPWAV